MAASPSSQQAESPRRSPLSQMNSGIGASQQPDTLRRNFEVSIPLDKLPGEIFFLLRRGKKSDYRGQKVVIKTPVDHVMEEP